MKWIWDLLWNLDFDINAIMLYDIIRIHIRGKIISIKNYTRLLWAYGLVGYDVAFTRRRSPVRIRLGPLFFYY